MDYKNDLDLNLDPGNPWNDPDSDRNSGLEGSV